VVAEQHLAVRPVARKAKRADAEQAVVDQVAEEDRPPLVGGVRLQRGEESLDVAVDVADDEDGQADPKRAPGGGG